MAPKPSPRFALMLFLLHMTTAISVYATVMPAVVKWSTILLVILNLFFCLARDVFLALPDSWHGVKLDNGGVSVGMRDGSGFIAQIANGTFVSPCFVLLRVRIAEHGPLVSRVIFSDALNANEYRELCIRLKFT